MKTISECFKPNRKCLYPDKVEKEAHKNHTIG